MIDFFAVLIQYFKESDPGLFRLVMCGALLLSGGFWWLGMALPRILKKNPPPALAHHLFCLVVSGITFLSTLFFFSIPYLQPFVEFSVNEWKRELATNGNLWNGAIDQSRKACEKLGIPQKDPEIVYVSYLGSDGKEINGMKAVSQIFANTILKNFFDTRPVLSLILWARGAEARAAMTESMVVYFEAHPGQIMDSRIVIDVGTGKILEDLDRQIPEILPLARFFLFFLVTLIQVVAFGLFGRSLRQAADLSLLARAPVTPTKNRSAQKTKFRRPKKQRG